MTGKTEDQGDGMVSLEEAEKAIDRDPKEGPVTVLGIDGECVWVMTPKSGQMLKVSPKASANMMISVFDGDPWWMIQHFPRFDNEGKPMKTDFSVRGIWSWLVKRAVERGVFDTGQVRLRGLGVWPGPRHKDGRRRPMLHLGSELWEAPGVGGELDFEGRPDDEAAWYDPGYSHDEAVYVGRPRVKPQPDFDDPATKDIGPRIREVLAMWRWEYPWEAGLLLGWIGLALLGGYPEWRVHALISAEFGSGKSTLMKFIRALLGPMQRAFNDLTEAGARSALANEARVLVVDEVERGEGGANSDGRVEKLIGLLRRMSGDEGASIGRGSANQAGLEMHLRGLALMCGINTPSLAPADRSRILRVGIKKVTAGDPTTQAKLKRETEWGETVSPALRARVVLRWPLFLECLDLYRSALIAKGCDGRQSDLLASLLAGRELLMNDHAPTSEESEAALAVLSPLIESMKIEDSESGDGPLCWNHMLSSAAAGDWRAGEHPTIGNVVAMGLGETMFAANMPPGTPPGRNSRALMRLGLRLMVVDEKVAALNAKFTVGDIYLLVANDHNQLARLFTGLLGQRWGGGNWNASLRRLGEDVLTWPKKERFAGAESRAIAIPAKSDGGYLPDPEFPTSSSKDDDPGPDPHG